MKIISFLLCASAVELTVTPVQKVLAMMDSMLEKGKKEAQAEEAGYKEYEAWCAETGTQKEQDIATATSEIDRLRASVLKAKADVSRLGDEIDGLNTAIAQYGSEKAAATKVRNEEHATYQTVHADYTESVDSLAESVREVEAQPKNIAGALLQLNARAKSLLDAAQPQAESSSFESSSGMILEMLEGLHTKMEDERTALEKEETEKVNAYDMQMQELTQMIESSQAERDDKMEKKGARGADAARDAADEADTVRTREEDRKYVAELKAQCEQKATDMNARRKLRAEEIEAVETAREIIAGNVASNAKKHLPQLLQRSFVQLRATAKVQTGEVASILERAAMRTGSKALAALALRVEDGPFDKVLGMIKGMIAKLTEQAGEEADHKKWCDGELQENKNSRDSKTATVNQLTATKEQLTAEIATLKEETSELAAGVAQLDKAMAEATSIRQSEKAKNKETVQDAKDAQAAVRQALQVLNKFYAKAAKATSFVQGPADDAPASFDSAYKGMGGESKGVVGMLEVILSDFVRLEAETSGAETEAAHAYDEFMGESNTDKTAKTDALDAKKKRTITQQRALQQANRDLSETQVQLDSALEYYDELKPACLDAGVDFAERAARRQEEVESLEQALQALGGE